LLKEKLDDLTFEKAVSKCTAHEQVNNKDVHAFKGEVEPNVKVHVLNNARRRQRQSNSKKQESNKPVPEQSVLVVENSMIPKHADSRKKKVTIVKRWDTSREHATP